MAGLHEEPRPTHPGEVLLKEYLEPRSLSQRDLATGIHVPYQRVNELVRGKRGVTPSTALRLARFLGTPTEYWLDLQARWDLVQAAQAEESALEEIEPGAFPAEVEMHYPYPSNRGVVLGEAKAGVVMGPQIQFPPDLLALLDRRGREQGLGLAEQVIEMVRAFLQGEVDPILQPGDPLLAAPVAEGSGLGDLAADHDRYLYARQDRDRSER
jgi:addiction module HigA family antidote